MEEKLTKIIKSDNRLLRIFLAEFLGHPCRDSKTVKNKIFRNFLTLLRGSRFNLSILAVGGNAEWNNTKIEYLLVIWNCSCRRNLYRCQCIRRTYQSSSHNRYCPELIIRGDKLENLLLSQCNFGSARTWYKRKCKNVLVVFDFSNRRGFLCFSNGLLDLFKSLKRHWKRFFWWFQSHSVIPSKSHFIVCNRSQSACSILCKRFQKI